ncbi:hypothetical protein DFS34DRAFT_647986 [Phlyctochytrium arcticum]|nr:hypothetical protein DFS34DRAFT_647986 [Phlyctochytrium arcticum]
MPSYDAYWLEDANLDEPAHCEAQESEEVRECEEEETVVEDNGSTFSFVRGGPEVLIVDEEFYRRRQAANARKEARELRLELALQHCLEQALAATLYQQAREERKRLPWWKKMVRPAPKKKGKRASPVSWEPSGHEVRCMARQLILVGPGGSACCLVTQQHSTYPSVQQLTRTAISPTRYLHPVYYPRIYLPTRSSRRDPHPLYYLLAASPSPYYPANHPNSPSLNTSRHSAIFIHWYWLTAASPLYYPANHPTSSSLNHSRHSPASSTWEPDYRRQENQPPRHRRVFPTRSLTQDKVMIIPALSISLFYNFSFGLASAPKTKS